MAHSVEGKDPSEVIDYSMDWSGVVGADPISSSNWNVAAGTVGIGSPPSTYTDDRTIVWVSGGIAGESCVLTNTVTTAGGRTFEQSIVFRVMQK